jgi:hypothetical protein
VQLHSSFLAGDFNCGVTYACVLLIGNLTDESGILRVTGDCDKNEEKQRQNYAEALPEQCIHCHVPA